ncbi:peptidase inhibitor family I36 protein [Kitasatospora sp. NPDC096077]|uniref:peptidase inhibitor family I36 protein n=1 Tax=Kitasatospora sp. NPDC096077 TaxID=3155544 RepID=UPI0033234AE9
MTADLIALAVQIALAATALLPRTAAQVAPGAQAVQASVPGPCAPGELCLWPQGGFEGVRQVYDLTRVDIESCTTLPPGTDAQSLANRTGRPVVAYQSDVCAETAEFATFPGDGIWAPEVRYRVRAFKLWEQ